MIPSSREIRLPPGMRDFLPLAAARRRQIAERLLAQFESWGYQRIITPLFECADVLERGLGADARAAAIRFVEPTSGEVVALRPDITPQVARIAATRMGDVGGPLRLCYEGAVSRLQTGPRGQRELLQAGIELINAGSPEGDVEAIAVAAAALATTGIEEVRLDVGHVGLAREALAAVPDPQQRAEVWRFLAAKDRRGVTRVLAGTNVAAPARALLEALPALFGTPADVLRRARALALSPQSRRAIDTLEAVLKMSRDIVERELHSSFTLDLGEVRGFEYYTGLRFAGYAHGVGDAVLRGGRYDELVARYGRSARATGFMVDIEAVAIAQEAGGIAPAVNGERVLVVAAPSLRSQGMRVAQSLRARGIRAALDLGEPRSRTALLRYAGAVGFSLVLILVREGARAALVPEDPRRPRAAAEVAISAAALQRAASGDARTLIAGMERLRRPRTRS